MNALMTIKDSFRKSFLELQIVAPLEGSEGLANLVFEAMNHPRRRFHSPEHLQEVTQDQDALGCLAALFHDVVYETVDDSMPRIWGVQCAKLVRWEGGHWHLTPEIQEFPEFWMTATVFGLEVGAQIGRGTRGTNEFLSAMAAVEHLHGLLSLRDLLAIVVAIEATIPFRDREHSSYLVEQAILAVGERLDLRLTPDLTREMIVRGLKLANQDVSNFATEDLGRFIHNNWGVLLENHTELQSPEAATLSLLREGIYSMVNFLSHLSTGLIFTEYLGSMGHEVYLQNIVCARKNLKAGSERLGLWVAAVGVLESLYRERGLESVPLRGLHRLDEALLGRRLSGESLPLLRPNEFEASWMSSLGGLVLFLEERIDTTKRQDLIVLTRKMSFEPVSPNELLTVLPNATLERLRALSI